MTVLVILIIVAVAVLVAMKTGKIKDANNNNIPDAIEEKVEAVKEAVAEVKEIVEKATKAPSTKKKPTAKTSAKKAK
jgi:predicted GTPase